VLGDDELREIAAGAVESGPVEENARLAAVLRLLRATVDDAREWAEARRAQIDRDDKRAQADRLAAIPVLGTVVGVEHLPIEIIGRNRQRRPFPLAGREVMPGEVVDVATMRVTVESLRKLVSAGWAQPALGSGATFGDVIERRRVPLAAPVISETPSEAPVPGAVKSGAERSREYRARQRAKAGR
jgi:hypothetical protein